MPPRPPRPPGRPKASPPRDVKVTVRLTEREAELLERVAGYDSLSKTIRGALDYYLRRLGGPTGLGDTNGAMLRRELRKARRAAASETADLEALFGFEEPAPEAEPPEGHA